MLILVMAHRPKPLQALLKILAPKTRVIVHYNANYDIGQVALPGNATFTRERFGVFWGGFNMILAIRHLIDEAYRIVPGFERAVLISGDTLPLYPVADIGAILADHTLEYIGITEIPNDPDLRGLPLEALEQGGRGVLAWRFQNFCHYDHELTNPRTLAETSARFGVDENTAIHLRGAAQALVRDILLQHPPRPALYEKFFYGEAWWALTRAALDLVIDDLHDERQVAFFRFLQVPEEHFIQTLLGNRQRALASLGRRIICSPVFVDHADPERAGPGLDTLRAEGFRRARRTEPYLFARKFDPDRTPEIARAIDRGTYFEDIASARDRIATPHADTVKRSSRQ